MEITVSHIFVSDDYNFHQMTGELSAWDCYRDCEAELEPDQAQVSLIIIAMFLSVKHLLSFFSIR
jgi:hypothetical protein